VGLLGWEKIVSLGNSGAGKSTLEKTLARSLGINTFTMDEFYGRLAGKPVNKVIYEVFIVRGEKMSRDGKGHWEEWSKGSSWQISLFFSMCQSKCARSE